MSSTEIWMIAIFVVALKIPVLASLWLVFWAGRAPEPEIVDSEDDGGGKTRRDRPPGDMPRGPRRRGPHGGIAAPAPARVRTVSDPTRRPERATETTDA